MENFMKIGSFLTCLLSLCFGLGAAPIVNDITPTVGPAAGGTVVTISGSGFTGTTTVNFGETPAASFIVNSDSSITAVSPPHSPQVINILVTAPSGTSAADYHSFFTFQGEWKAYVTNSDSDNVSVINTTSNTVTATIPVGIVPELLDILPDGSKVFVENNVGETQSVIDVATDTVENTIFTFGGHITALLNTPNGAKNYLADIINNNVIIIDNATQTVIGSINVGNQPSNLAITPDGTKLYSFNTGDATLSVINTANDTVIATIPVGNSPLCGCATPDSSKLYVPNANDNTVSVIDTASNTVIATIPVGDFPRGVAITPDGTRALVANAVSADVSIIDTASNAVIATLPAGFAADMISITPDSKKAYVANENSSTETVIDIPSLTVIATIPIGQDPESQVMTPDGKQLYVVNDGDDNVTVIDTTTDSVTATIPVGGEPIGIGMTPDQAPLAQFTITTAFVGAATIFDASGSNSPTGTIANYFWDFGDGSPTVNTANPVISHVYSAPGTYTITLIVTNTAGTSLEQIFYFTSYSVFAGSQPSVIVNNNGGPTAERIHPVTIELAPPSHLVGCVKKNKFLNKTEYTVNATFTPSSSPNISFYRVYVGNVVVLEIPGSGPFSFTICIKSASKAQEVSVTAVVAGGIESAHVPITLTGSCCSE